jgi:hypothetical protein
VGMPFFQVSKELGFESAATRPSINVKVNESERKCILDKNRDFPAMKLPILSSSSSALIC